MVSSIMGSDVRDRPQSPTMPERDDEDITLIRWMLSLSVEERLQVLQGFVDSVAALNNERT